MHGDCLVLFVTGTLAIKHGAQLRCAMQENNGLLGLMDTQLFRDDVMLQPGPFGPQDIRVVLRSSGV